MSRFASVFTTLKTPALPLVNQFKTWLFQWRGPEPGPIVLSQRRVFIMPTRHGVWFGIALLVMLVGAMNYALSLGFALTFLLAALGINSIFYTFRNLARLRIAPGRVAPVFVGDTARFALHIENTTKLDRYAVGVTHTTGIPHDTLNTSDVDYCDVPARATVTTYLSVIAEKRGWLTPGRFSIFTFFPLGLCRAWGYANLGVRCLVYPKPALSELPLPLSSAAVAGSHHLQGEGEEDFAGLREYHPGDALGHVAWKSVARDDLLRTKQFSGAAATEIQLDWYALPAQMHHEARISQLTRWVLDAHAASLRYGLRLPNAQIELNSGDAHRDHCLEILALHD